MIFILAPSNFTAILNDGVVQINQKKKRDTPMTVYFSKSADFDSWIALAREVEPLFGPMADEMDFQEALRQAILAKTAFCLYPDRNQGAPHLIGGVIISKESNEIAWLVVSKQYRKKGWGRELIKFAISRLNQGKSIIVQTFDKSVSQGASARNLYLDFGFTDVKNGGLNPAGVPTVIMQRKAIKTQGPGDETPSGT